MKRVFPSLLSLLSLLPLPLLAQAPQGNAIPAQQEEMKKLDFLVGQWKGEGWVKMPGAERQTFTQTETVQKKLGGLALLVEGQGTSKLPSGEEKTVFEALAMVTWDPEKNLYRSLRPRRRDGPENPRGGSCPAAPGSGALPSRGAAASGIRSSSRTKASGTRPDSTPRMRRPGTCSTR